MLVLTIQRVEMIENELSWTLFDLFFISGGQINFQKAVSREFLIQVLSVPMKNVLQLSFAGGLQNLLCTKALSRFATLFNILPCCIQVSRPVLLVQCYFLPVVSFMGQVGFYFAVPITLFIKDFIKSFCTRQVKSQHARRVQ